MAASLRPLPVPASRRPAAVEPPPDSSGRRDAWLKAGVLLCAAALAGVLWAAALPHPDDAPPPPRVEKAHGGDGVLYEDQYVRIYADSPDKTTDGPMETSP